MENLQCIPVRAKYLQKIIWLFYTFYNLSKVRSIVENYRLYTYLVWMITMCETHCKTHLSVRIREHIEFKDSTLPKKISNIGVFLCHLRIFLENPFCIRPPLASSVKLWLLEVWKMIHCVLSAIAYEKHLIWKNIPFSFLEKVPLLSEVFNTVLWRSFYFLWFSQTPTVLSNQKFEPFEQFANWFDDLKFLNRNKFHLQCARNCYKNFRVVAITSAITSSPVLWSKFKNSPIITFIIYDISVRWTFSIH